MAEAEEMEYYVVPRYPRWKMLLLEPMAQRWRFTLKGWMLVHLIPYVVSLYVWFTLTERKWYETPWWFGLWGLILLGVFLLVDSYEFQRLFTYVGVFYLLRGANQEAIRELKMGSTSRLVVRAANATAAACLLWLLDYVIFWRAWVVASGWLLLVKYGIAYLLFFLFFYGVDQWWGFQRTRIAGGVMVLLWFITLTLYWVFWEVTSDITICPPWLCPERGG